MKRQFLVNQRAKAKNGESQITCGGFALMTVLLLTSLLTVMLVSLLFVSDEENVRSQTFLGGERARTYIDIALQEVQAKLMDGGEIPYREGVATASMTACPGLLEVRRYDVLPNRGYQKGNQAFQDKKSFFRNPFASTYEREREGDWQPANPRWISLYSQKWYAPLCRYITGEGPIQARGPSKIKDKNPDYNPERTFNINTPDNPFTPGSLYLGGPSGQSVGLKNVSLGAEYAEKGKEKPYRYNIGETSAERPVMVQWIPLYKDPRYGATRPDGSRNPIVGRYAYWVDVENTKINISTIKREWEKTALGQLTGKSNAERGKRRGGHYQQWGEKKKETARYTAEQYKLNTYQRIRDEVENTYGVELYYRPNYVERKNRQNEYVAEVYERQVFGWEEETLPPAIADTSVIDFQTFSALRPYRKHGEDASWLNKLPTQSKKSNPQKYNMMGELYAMLDPQVERKDRHQGQVSMSGFEKTYGQAFTVYGWEEERDPLGRTKLDINAIIREGDALFTQKGSLPRAHHQGTPLQQLLARLEDSRYHAAYYPGAYPTDRGLSFVEGLAAFAGRGANTHRYAQAMRDQMVVNLIEYGRDVEEPPYVDEERGVIGAKSMPYVAEVAIRMRSALWDLWDEYDPETYDPDTLPAGGYPSGFPGLYEYERVYDDEFKRHEVEELYIAQKIYDVLLSEIITESDNPGSNTGGGTNGTFTGIAIAGIGPGVGAGNGSGGIFGEAGATGLSTGVGTGTNNNINEGLLGENALDVPLAENRGGRGSYMQYLNHVLVDVAFGLVNPDPYGRDKVGDWEMEVGYSWYDPVSGAGEEWEEYGNFGEMETMNSELVNASGQKLLGSKVRLEKKPYSPYLLPNGDTRIDGLGYVYGESHHQKQEHYLGYFRPGTGLVPGVLVGGGAKEAEKNMLELAKAFQSFRLWGWQIRRKGEQRYHHQVPLRHPGQVSEPRKFWEMTVDRDGPGPELAPNCGVLAATLRSTYGLKTGKQFHYVDFHSLEHFRSPLEHVVNNLEESDHAGIAIPFGLGLDKSESWEGLKERKNVAASWVSSQTILEFEKYCESLMATIPPEPGGSFMIKEKSGSSGNVVITEREISAPDDPKYFYHVEEELGQPFRGLEGKLYFPERAMEKLIAWLSPNIIGGVRKTKARSDLMRFLLLQTKLRDEAMHHEKVASDHGRNQESTGRLHDDEFVEGAAMVERLVCIDPVVGHRTGNADLRIERQGQEYSGHAYGVNGCPWRRYHYYMYHHDKDNRSPQHEILGENKRPEPDRCLTWHFRDPRRCDGGRNEPRNYIADKEGNYGEWARRKIPLQGVTGSVLWNALLTKNKELPDLCGEKAWSQVTELEEEGVHVWPYGPGMDVSYGYNKRKKPAHDRTYFRNGSFLTHSPRGELMTSIGEIGLCHSGFLQRAIDLDRPPLMPGKGVKRLGSPQHGPPMSMLLDLITPSNFNDEKGRYLAREDWEKGKYKVYSPQYPRLGTWNLNSRIAHDNYLAVREGAYGTLSNEPGGFHAEDLRGARVHPVLVPNAVGQRKSSIEVVEGTVTLDPNLSPFVRFRRGWEHWLGVLAGDYSEYRNMGGGVWNKEHDREKWEAGFSESGETYSIAQGTLSFSWHPGGAGDKERAQAVIRFDHGKKARLLALGQNNRGEIDRKGLGGHVSADGPLAQNGQSAYPLKKGDNVSLYDVTRYALFPMVHHISEVGYTGLGKVYTVLNYKNRTTPAASGFAFEEKLIDQQAGGDGVLGAMSQAGFARNTPWVMSGNQMSTSANVFTVHIVTQSLRDVEDLSRRDETGVEVRSESKQSPSSPLQSSMSGLGYMDKEDEIHGEQWAQVVIAKVPQKNVAAKIVTNKQGAPQYSYHVLSQQIIENPQ